MRYKHVIFDIDGTLINTENAAMRSLQDTILTMTGKLYELDQLTVCFGLPAAETLEHFHVEDVQEGRKLWDQNMKKYLGTVEVFDGILEIVDELYKKNCGLGLVTSKTRHEFEQDFAHFGMNHYFTTVICADDTTEHKPYPEPLYKYMELTGTVNTEILYIGDSIYDLKCGQAAGVDFAAAGWGTKFLTTGDGTYYAKDPKDLKMIIDF